MSLVQRLERVRQRIGAACERSGRAPAGVTLIGVTKTVPAEAIFEAAAAGLRDVGENRVQDARAKQAALGDASRSVRWHFIGHLQRNKALDALELFDVIHSVDSPALADALSRYAQRMGRSMEVLLQVNISGEATKNGCRPEELLPLGEHVLGAAGLTLGGLMTMAPFSDVPETSRPVFRRLRLLRDQMSSGFQIPTSSLRLSMGMSQDFEVAIEEGADLIRVGTAIFGTRDKGQGT